MAINSLLPWHQDHWRKLCSKALQQKMPHAWLFTGTKGSGVEQYAEHFARYALCLTPDSGQNCGTCQACRWLSADAHPDFVVLAQQDSLLGIDDVRELSSNFLQPAHSKRPKVAVIHNVDYFTPVVANALLKTLEEPQIDALFVLTATSVHNVLPTIASRLFKVSLPQPTQAEERDYLGSMDDIPAKVRAQVESLQIAPLIVEKWHDNGFMEHFGCVLKPFFSTNQAGMPQAVKVFNDYPKESLYLLYNWLVCGIRINLQGNEMPPSLFKPHKAFIDTLGLNQLWNYYKIVLDAIQALKVPSINKQLLYESLVYQWSGIHVRTISR